MGRHLSRGTAVTWAPGRSFRSRQRVARSVLSWLRRRAVTRGLVLALLSSVLTVGATGVAAPANAAQWAGVQVTNDWTETCLDVNPSTWWNNPGQVYLWSCNQWWNQTWFATWPDRSGESTWSEIRVPGPPVGPPNKCLDAWPDSTKSGGYRVGTWECNGQDQQYWRLENVLGNVKIRNVRFGLKCLDTPWDGPTDGRYVGLWDCHGGRNQDWNLYRVVH